MKNHGWIISALHHQRLPLSCILMPNAQAFRSKKAPVPLLAPTYSFTGKDRWTPLMQSWDKMRDLEKFKGIDYMIPTLSKDSTGVIARPSAADGALRWLKAALHRHWGATVDPSILANLTWHSFRVFVPDCAYQLGFPRDQRQYLGNWTTETTADIYTRDKRNVVEKVWKAVGDKMCILKLDNPTALRRIDLNHEDWDDPIPVQDDVRRELDMEVLDTPDHPREDAAMTGSHSNKRRRTAGSLGTWTPTGSIAGGVILAEI